MSRTDHARPAKRPEHSDHAPKQTPRPDERRAKSRRQAVLRWLRLNSSP